MRFISFAILIFFSSILAADDVENLTVVFSEDNPPFSHISETGEVIGLLPDLVREVFDRLDNVSIESHAYPWSRAQYLIETSQRDLFCTYPSSSRQEYALFTENPLLHLDYDYLIFSKDNENAQRLLDVDVISDLTDFVMVSHSATAWEEDNIPKEVERLYVARHEQLFHMIFGRDAGDFIIMNLEEAVYHADLLGYGEELLFKKVDFIPDSSIPFHLGIRKTYYSKDSLINRLDKILESDDFITDSNMVFRKYK